MVTRACRYRAGSSTGQTDAVLDLLPLTATIADGQLSIGGVSATRLAEEHGTPLVVYCEETIRAQARAYRAAAPGAVIVYGTKAFANVAILRVLAEEGVGADVSTLGELAGIHFHVGSQLARVEESLVAVDRLVAFCARAESELGWRPQVLDIGGGLGIRYTREEHVPTIADFVPPLVARLPHATQIVLEPGRSLVGRAGVTLYRVGVVNESGGVSYVAVDGGMSDNPRPQLYGARFEALLANRAEELADGIYRIAGKHCESGDVLIQAAELPRPRRGDLLAVPATGAYTLAMGSTYNGVPRPAVVLVRDGEARVIRRRESTDDLLRYESS